MDSMALTKKGWREYKDLVIGEEICTYNIKSDFLEWKPITNLYYFKSAQTVNISTPKTNFNFICTPNHKWVLKQSWKKDKYLKNTELNSKSRKLNL
jgi:hypothetical protein